MIGNEMTGSVMVFGGLFAGFPSVFLLAYSIGAGVPFSLSLVLLCTPGVVLLAGVLAGLASWWLLSFLLMVRTAR